MLVNHQHQVSGIFLHLLLLRAAVQAADMYMHINQPRQQRMAFHRMDISLGEFLTQLLQRPYACNLSAIQRH